MKPTIKLFNSGDTIKAGLAEWRFINIDKGSPLWYGNLHYFVSPLPPKITSWMRGDFDMLKAIICDKCNVASHCYKCKGTGYYIDKESDPEKEKGLYHKYDVFKAGTKEPVEDCIVLKFSDPLAQAALYTFAQDMDAAGYKSLADDVFARIC